MPIDGRSSALVRSRQPSTTGDDARERDDDCRLHQGDPAKYRAVVATSRAEEIRRLERGWWRRLPLILVRPGEVFAELRDSSDEQAEALSEPMVAVTILAGTAMFLSTATAGRLFDNPEFDWLLIAVRGVLRRRARGVPELLARRRGAVARPAEPRLDGALPHRPPDRRALDGAVRARAARRVAVADRDLRRGPLPLGRLGRRGDRLRPERRRRRASCSGRCCS